LFGPTSLEIFARVDLGLIFNKQKGRYEWMVNEVERMPNASLWILNRTADIHHGSDIPKEIAKDLSDCEGSDYPRYKSVAEFWLYESKVWITDWLD
jgi:hypothetical protein